MRSNEPFTGGDPRNKNWCDVRAKDAGILNWLQARRWRRLRSDEFPRRRRTAETELKDKQR
jgi:hypothetical protein